jgi:hypothetical protein
MDLKRAQIIEELPFGVYVWEVDGKWVADDDGNWACIAAQKGDMKRMAELKNFVAYYGVTEGHPVFLSGHRPVTEDEYNTQRQRMEWGLLPDTEDVASLAEDLRNSGKRN